MVCLITTEISSFAMGISLNSLESVKSIHLFFRVDVKTFPMHDVSAIGLKFPGSCGFVFAASLRIRRITPCFHVDGIEADSQQAM